MLFDQLRARRLAAEQKETYVKQQEAALRLRELNEATAAAAKQAELTQTKIEIEGQRRAIKPKFLRSIGWQTFGQ